MMRSETWNEATSARSIASPPICFASIRSKPGVDPQFREDDGAAFDRLFDEHWNLWLDQELSLRQRARGGLAENSPSLPASIKSKPWPNRLRRKTSIFGRTPT